MKKLFLIGFTLFTLSFAYAGGYGTGLTANLKQNSNLGGNFNYKLDGFPIAVTANILCGEEFSLSCTELKVDYWLSSMNLYKGLNFYYGPALALGFDFDENKTNIDNGFLAGLNIFVSDDYEFYIQAEYAPQILIGTSSAKVNFLNFPVSVGIRLW